MLLHHQLQRSLFFISLLLVCVHLLLRPKSSPSLRPMTVMPQKAILLHEIGKPLTLGDRQIPQPAENQLLLKVHVAGRMSYNPPNCSRDRATTDRIQ